MLQKTEQSDHATQVVEHFFRHECSKVIAGLTGKYGVAHMRLSKKRSSRLWDPGVSVKFPKPIGLDLSGSAKLSSGYI